LARAILDDLEKGMSAITSHELSEIADVDWDAVVIGAGPAGALTAQQLATGGLRTMLVEAKRFPRAKVCGGCLNRRGVAALRRAGIGHLLDDCHAARVHTLHWIVGQQRARFVLPEMRVVDRATFDAALVHEAAAAGAIFVDGVQAYVEPGLSGECRIIKLTHQTECITIRTRVAIAADGLARSSLKRLPEFRSLTAPDSRIGVGATLPHDGTLVHDEVMMVVGRHGYVGLAATGGDALNVAAALDPRAIGRSSVGKVITEMVRAAGISVTGAWAIAEWHGTPLLTSRPGRVAAERLVVIGDASGYVEPFSGEGMATALETALAVAPLAIEAASHWRPAIAMQWEAAQRALVAEPQSTCRQLAWILRHGWMAAAAIALCRIQPWVARRYITKVS
jgi:flavin-dependent dehydrogenase